MTTEGGVATATEPTETGAIDGGLLASAREAAQAKAAATPTPDSTPVAQRPADIPENFWDAQKGVPRVDDLVKSWKAITADRDRLKQQQQQTADPAPESADKYLDPTLFKDNKLILSDKTASWGDIPADDPMLTGFAEACHKIGIGQRQFAALLPQVMEQLAPKLPAPIDAKAELALLDDGIPGRGQQMVDSITNYVNRSVAHGELSNEEAAIIDAWGRDAESIRTLAKIIKMNGTQPIPISPNAISDKSVSKDEWKMMVRSDRYRDDEAYRNYVDSIAARLYPEN